MENEQMSRLGIALAISVGLHLFVAIVGEISSSPAKPKLVQAPPVEITRVAMDGTSLPSGPGMGRVDSPASSPNTAFGAKYGLDAGVPMKLPVPAPQNRPPSAPNPGAPVNPAKNPTSAPPSYQPPTSDFPPINQGTTDGSAPQNSSSSQASNSGNQAQKRSRGPNRAAFPDYTVEPSVPLAMIVAGVTNSVDVSVEIAADGSHTEKIVRSSGSGEVDALVLAALAQWRWDPAARDGQAIASSQNFKFTFKPR